MKILQNKTHQDQIDHNENIINTYPIAVSPLSEEEGGGFQALFPPLARTVVGYGRTPMEAIAELQTMVPSLLEAMAETEQALPEVVAEKEWEDFSGKFNVRVAKMLHAQLVELAEEQGVSLNSLVQTVLTSGATALAAGKMFGVVERRESKQESYDSWHGDAALDGTQFPSENKFVTQQTFSRERMISMVDTFSFIQEDDRRLNSG